SKLVGPHVTAALPGVGAPISTLVSAWAEVGAQRNGIDGRAAILQGQGLGRPTIACQGTQLGVGVLHAARAGEAATAIARQIVALIERVVGKVVVAVAARVVRHNAPAEARRAAVDEAAAAEAGRVVGN